MDLEKRIDGILQQMSREEKASLTAGLDMWHTQPLERLGIPALKLSDGPNGVRGESRDSHPVSSASFPAGTALGATWNPDLIGKIGRALAEEAHHKGVHVLLGPTVNMHRVPLAGRNFECFSEDPYLSSRLAVAYIRGLQENGVAACVKHFVCNDQETNRFTISAEVSDRALHEIYLPPFKAAVQEAGVQALMTAYNQLNGIYASENPDLLLGILKEDWGFDGLVISDWYGTYSERAAAAGCDLEMPGPARFMGQKALQDPAPPSPERLNDQVRRLLRILLRARAFQASANIEQSVNQPEHQALIRKAGAEAIVLLKNTEDILPLDMGQFNKVALIGKLAQKASFQGGGSAQVAPHYVVSALDAFQSRYPGKIHYAQGYEIDRLPPPLDGGWLIQADPDKEPISATYYGNPQLSGKPVHQAACRETSLSWFGETAPHWDPKHFSVRMEGQFQPPEAGEYTFTLSLIGRGRLLIDQEVLLELWEDPAGQQQGEIDLTLEASRTYGLTIEYASDLDLRWRKVYLGAKPKKAPDLLKEAVALAAQADLALVIAGLTPEWESEGFDRDSLSLPGDQDGLIQAVSQANPNTIVVLHSGSPVAMPWLKDVRGLLQAWYLGQESGNALVDVLCGGKDPGGRLPTTFPASIQDTPGAENFPGREGKVRYQEGIFIGYRHYDRHQIQPLFPFGYGLSYTSFAYQDLRLNGRQFSPGDVIKIKVDVSNTGQRTGQEVVQLYLRDPNSTRVRPEKELKRFKKITLAPGETRTIDFTLSERDLAYYDDLSQEWVAEPGEFQILVGRSSADILHSQTIHWVPTR